VLKTIILNIVSIILYRLYFTCNCTRIKYLSYRTNNTVHNVLKKLKNIHSTETHSINRNNTIISPPNAWWWLLQQFNCNFVLAYAISLYQITLIKNYISFNVKRNIPFRVFITTSGAAGLYNKTKRRPT